MVAENHQYLSVKNAIEALAKRFQSAQKHIEVEEIKRAIHMTGQGLHCERGSNAEAMARISLVARVQRALRCDGPHDPVEHASEYQGMQRVEGVRVCVHPLHSPGYRPPPHRGSASAAHAISARI